MSPLTGMTSTCVRPRPMPLSGLSRPRVTVTFPPAETADPHGLVLVGGDLAPATLLDAYRSGLFPMRDRSGALAWWSPDPRGVLRPEQLHVSASLRQACHRYEIRVDSAFEAVIDACADRGSDEYAWITPEVRAAYLRLHRLGWAHSVEAWTKPKDGTPAELVGGLYGVAIGGLFGGESMFHRRPDASKVALVALVELMRDGRGPDEAIIDVQWQTPHLASLGATTMSRGDYLDRLRDALQAPLPRAFATTR